jgi:ribosomal protein L22
MAEEKDKTAESSASRPGAAAKKPAAKKESASKKPTPRKPAAKKAPASKSAAKKAPAKKPAEKKTEAKKPAAKPKAESKKEAPAPPTVRASARYLRVAPRKARLVADQIRGLQIDDARALLQFSSRGAANELGKLLDSAAANAENNHDLVADDLAVAEISVDEGPTLRRWRPRALGRATRINKRTSHVSIALRPKETV